MRRNAVRSIAVETSLFGQKELEQLYAAFKVIVAIFQITELQRLVVRFRRRVSANPRLSGIKI